MKTFEFNRVKVPATDQKEAADKLRSALMLAARLDGHTLAALARKGPDLLHGPDGQLIRNYLGI